MPDIHHRLHPLLPHDLHLALILPDHHTAVLRAQLPPAGGGGGLVEVVGGDALLRDRGLLLEEEHVKHGHMSNNTTGALSQSGQSLRVPLMPLSGVWMTPLLICDRAAS